MANWNEGFGPSIERHRQRNAETLAAAWPEVEEGMFVQLDTWFGDIWAEITWVYRGGDNKSRWRVSFIRYEKHGVSRKKDSAFWGDIRKFCRAEDLPRGQAIIYTRGGYTRYHEARVVWPADIDGGRWRNGYQYREDQVS